MKEKKNKRTYNSYTDEEILNNIKEFINETRETSLKRYKEYSNRLCSENAIDKHFGNWTLALKKLGIEPKIHHCSTKEEVTEDVLRIFKETNCTLRENYLANGKYSRCILKKHFGTWNNMLKELGYKINMLKPGQYTKQEILDCYIKMCKDYGRELTALEFRKDSPYSQPIIDGVFGSFSNLKKELGLKYFVKEYSDEDIKNILLEIEEKMGFVNGTLVEAISRINVPTLINKYGSVENACEKFNINFKKGDGSVFQKEVTLLISEILGDDYEIEKTFDWLVYKHNLRVDLYYEKLKLAIEIDGNQHYKFCPYFHKSYEDFQCTQDRDKTKDKLLKEHGINVIRISSKDVKNINIMLKDYIDNNKKQASAIC